MAINFAAANTAGLNNPGTEIITLVKDGGGNFINPPSYDKMRAYLSSGEVPMLFVTAEGGESGSLYQLVEYSETENKIRFSNDKTTIAFSAGADTPVVSDVVPKPLTYDYMPEGYPKKSVQTVPLIADTNVELTIYNDSGIGAVNDFFNDANIVVGKQYVVNLDGSKYNVTAEPAEKNTYIGNLILFTMTQNNMSYDETKTFLDENHIPYTEEPFCIVIVPSSTALKNQLIVRSTSASHIIGVSESSEAITPMAEEFLPVLMSPNGTKYKITVDDSGTLTATAVT